jgi:hypothetical protein
MIRRPVATVRVDHDQSRAANRDRDFALGAVGEDP